MAMRNGSSVHQFMTVADVLVTNGDFMDKRQILEACDGTGIVENRLSTYLWECKLHGGDLVKEKRDGVPKWKMTVLPTPPDFNARKATKVTTKVAKAPKATISTTELVALLTDDALARPASGERFVVTGSEPDQVLEAAAKPSAPRRGRSKAKPVAEKETLPASENTEEAVVEVSEDEDRTKDLLKALGC